jgi:hypothetical protein
MACSTTRRATAVKSRSAGFDFSLLAREGMAHSGTNPTAPSGSAFFKLTHYHYRFWCFCVGSPTIHRMVRQSVEEHLRAVEGWAAMIRYLAMLGAVSQEPPSPSALDGISETCEDIEDTIHAIRRALPAEALNVTLPGAE